MAKKPRVNRSRIWSDRIEVVDMGLYAWSIYHGTVLKKKGIAFTPDEAQKEIDQAREELGA